MFAEEIKAKPDASGTGIHDEFKTLNMADKSISLVLCTVARTLVVIPRGYLPMSAINDIGYNHDINPTQESGRQSSSLQLHESRIPFLPTWPPFRSLSWVFRGIAPRDSPQNSRDEQKFYGQTKVLDKNKCSGLIVWAIFFFHTLKSPFTKRELPAILWERNTKSITTQLLGPLRLWDGRQAT